MTKQELIKRLEGYTDDIQIVVDYKPFSEMFENVMSVEYDQFGTGVGFLKIRTYRQEPVRPAKYSRAATDSK